VTATTRHVLIFISKTEHDSEFAQGVPLPVAGVGQAEIPDAVTIDDTIQPLIRQR